MSRQRTLPDRNKSGKSSFWSSLLIPDVMAYVLCEVFFFLLSLSASLVLADKCASRQSVQISWESKWKWISVAAGSMSTLA